MSQSILCIVNNIGFGILCEEYAKYLRDNVCMIDVIYKFDLINIGNECEEINMSVSAMFQGATEFNGTISVWDTGGVTKMSAMFQGASQFNVEVLDWDKVLDNLASDLTTDVASLRNKDVFDNLASGLTTDVASLRNKDVFGNLASGLTTDITSLRNKDVFGNLVSGLTTGVASLRKKDVFGNLASGLTTDVASIRTNDRRTNDTLDNLTFRLAPFVASSLAN